jgi:hypothetical protein
MHWLEWNVYRASDSIASAISFVISNPLFRRYRTLFAQLPIPIYMDNTNTLQSSWIRYISQSLQSPIQVNRQWLNVNISNVEVPPWETACSSAGQVKPPLQTYRTRSLMTIFITVWYWLNHNLNPFNTVHIPTYYLRFILILSSHLSLHLLLVLFSSPIPSDNYLWSYNSVTIIYF